MDQLKSSFHYLREQLGDGLVGKLLVNLPALKLIGLTFIITGLSSIHIKAYLKYPTATTVYETPVTSIDMPNITLCTYQSYDTTKEEALGFTPNFMSYILFSFSRGTYDGLKDMELSEEINNLISNAWEQQYQIRHNESFELVEQLKLINSFSFVSEAALRKMFDTTVKFLKRSGLHPMNEYEISMVILTTAIPSANEFPQTATSTIGNIHDLVELYVNHPDNITVYHHLTSKLCNPSLNMDSEMLKNLSNDLLLSAVQVMAKIKTGDAVKNISLEQFQNIACVDTLTRKRKQAVLNGKNLADLKNWTAEEFVNATSISCESLLSTCSIGMIIFNCCKDAKITPFVSDLGMCYEFQTYSPLVVSGLPQIMGKGHMFGLQIQLNTGS